MIRDVKAAHDGCRCQVSQRLHHVMEHSLLLLQHPIAVHQQLPALSQVLPQTQHRTSDLCPLVSALLVCHQWACLQCHCHLEQLQQTCFQLIHAFRVILGISLTAERRWLLDRVVLQTRSLTSFNV